MTAVRVSYDTVVKGMVRRTKELEDLLNKSSKVERAVRGKATDLEADKEKLIRTATEYVNSLSSEEDEEKIEKIYEKQPEMLDRIDQALEKAREYLSERMVNDAEKFKADGDASQVRGYSASQVRGYSASQVCGYSASQVREYSASQVRVVEQDWSQWDTVQYAVTLVNKHGQRHLVRAGSIESITSPIDGVMHKFPDICPVMVQRPVSSVGDLSLYETIFGTGMLLGGTDPALRSHAVVINAKVKDKISEDDMKTIADKCDEAIKWLDANQLAEIVPRLYRDCTEIVPRLYRDCTEIVPRLYRDCTESHAVVFNAKAEVEEFNDKLSDDERNNYDGPVNYLDHHGVQSDSAMTFRSYPHVVVFDLSKCYQQMFTVENIEELEGKVLTMRIKMNIATAQDVIITISKQEFRHGSLLQEEGHLGYGDGVCYVLHGRGVDLLSLGSPCRAIEACVVAEASPRVKYINVDEVQMTVEMKCEPAELAENHDADNFEELLEEVSDIENNSEVFGQVMKQK